MFTALIAIAGVTAPLPPAGKWVVDFADEQCVASRTFGAAKDPWVLVIKPSPTSDVVQLLAIEKGGPQMAVQGDARVTIGKAPPITVKQLHYAVKGNGIHLINLEPEQASELADADVIQWAGDGPGKSFPTGPIGKLMQTLAACRADLRNHWNIAPEKRELLQSVARPRKPLIRYFSTNDYPWQAVRSSESGLTSVVLLIDERGSIKDCMIDGTSNIATLDAMTCVVFRERAKFDPAIGKDGKPVRSHYMQRVRWEMP